MKTVATISKLLFGDLEGIYQQISLHRELNTIYRNLIAFNTREIARVVTIAVVEFIILPRKTVHLAPEVVTVTPTTLAAEMLTRLRHRTSPIGIRTRIMIRMLCLASNRTTIASNCRPQ